jgi:hypothetical protein
VAAVADESLVFGPAPAAGGPWDTTSGLLAHASGAAPVWAALVFVALLVIVAVRRPPAGIVAAVAAVAVLVWESIRHTAPGAADKGFLMTIVFPLVAGLALASLRKTSLALFAALVLAGALAVQQRVAIIVARDRRVRVAEESLPQLPVTMPGVRVIRLNCPAEMRILFRRRFGEVGEARIEDIALLMDGGSPILPRGVELDIARPVVEFDGSVFRSTSVQDLLTRPVPPELWFAGEVEPWPAGTSPLATMLRTTRRRSFAREPQRFVVAGRRGEGTARITSVGPAAADGSGRAREIEIEVDAAGAVLLAVPALPPGADLRELGAQRFGWPDAGELPARDAEGRAAEGVRYVGWVDGGVAVFRCEAGKRRFRLQVP